MQKHKRKGTTDARSRGGRTSGARRDIQQILDLFDTTSPSWPYVVVVFNEFTRAGIELDATTAPFALKLGELRYADAQHEQHRPLPSVQMSLAGVAESLVYYIQRGGLIKIGTTRSPASRFSGLRPDAILAIEPGARPQEVQRHHQFAHLHVGGEYFHDAPELREHIEYIRALHGEPDPAWPTMYKASRVRMTQPLPVAVSDEVLTVAEAEEQLGIRKITTQMWIRRGRLPVAGLNERGHRVVYRDHLVALRERATGYAAWREGIFPQGGREGGVNFGPDGLNCAPPADIAGGALSYTAGGRPLLLPEPASDGEIYILTKDAAAAMGVAVCTVSQWRRRGYLEPVPGSPPRKPLYRLSDVRRAEKLTRDNAIRVSGSDAQVQRMRGVEI
jgi:hypothetical protein